MEFANLPRPTDLHQHIGRDPDVEGIRSRILNSFVAFTSLSVNLPLLRKVVMFTMTPADIMSEIWNSLSASMRSPATRCARMPDCCTINLFDAEPGKLAAKINDTIWGIRDQYCASPFMLSMFGLIGPSDWGQLDVGAGHNHASVEGRGLERSRDVRLIFFGDPGTVPCGADGS